MDYSILVDLYESLEKTSGRLKKVELIAEVLKKTKPELLPIVTRLVQGKVFSTQSENEIGIAAQLTVKIISLSTGFPPGKVVEKFKELGDYGLVVEEFVKKKRQATLFKKKLTVEKVFENLEKLAHIEGKGSQEKKFHLVSELVHSADPKAAKYIIRTTLGDIRIGVAQGVIRDSISRAFFPDAEGDELKDVVKIVERAWFLRPDYGEIAQIAKEKGLAGMKRIKLKIGMPYHVLLSEKSPSLEEALKTFEKVALEWKYDGARISIHKKGDKINLFTRRMENVTKQFPDVVNLVIKSVKSDSCVIEGEMLGMDSKANKSMPFQFLSQRIRRKYDIEKLAEKIPVQVNLFDIVLLDDEMLFDVPLKERYKKLLQIIKIIPGKFQIAKQLITNDLKKAEAFYKDALENNQEGVMVKNLDAFYQPGRRVGYWLKVKPIMETLDLAVIGATWGMGKRTGWLGSLILGCRDPDSDEFLECGMLGTGIKEKGEGTTFEELTEMLRPYIISESGSSLKISPKIIIEVAYEEIQKSPTYTSGYALRFPRLIRLRTADKGPEDADDLTRLISLYKKQRGR
ncbi:MAG: ATP-dependent DNA ligase [Candidatus Aenigmatarchaeota archaeon]|nr:ATP-dependent DNA ligase [Nanoarchaeota archaeon]